MGKIIPLFPTVDPEPTLPLTREQSIRLRMVSNSIEALRREEDAIKEIIEKKCREELDRLDRLTLKLRQLEQEAAGIRNIGKARRTGIYPAPPAPGDGPSPLCA